MCSASFTGNLCQTAILTNVCLSNPCMNSGTCVTTGSTYYCLCTSSFTGNQVKLKDYNPII
jgi:hypothetical protein